MAPILGTVLINFGGPSGPGATNLPVWADDARANIGDQGTSYLTGGVIPVKRDNGALVSANLTEVFLNGGWEAAGQLADFRASEANEAGTLIGTTFVARDIIEIVDALGEDGLLRYYVWSYGTALGSYVAAMYPGRVERMALDGNLNPHDYQAGHYGEFPAGIHDTFTGFLNTCFNVTEDCALYTQIQSTSTQALLDAINSALTPLAQNSTSGIEAYLTYLNIKSSFVNPLYFPRVWPTFAEDLAALLNGSVPTTAGPPPEAYGEVNQALIGIRASDATFIANSSKEYLSKVQFQSTVSSGFSDTSYFALWPSAWWRMPAKERY